MLKSDRYRFRKKRVGTRYTKVVFLHPLGSVGHILHSSAFGREMLTHYFSYSDGTSTDCTKSAPGHITSNLCFCIRCDMRITWCIPVHPGCETSTHYFSCSLWDRCGIHKKRIGTRYTEQLFLYLVGSATYTVHSDASGVGNIDALFFMLGWALCGFHKNHTGIRYAKHVFLHPVGSAGHVVHSGASGSQILMHYFSCLGRTGLDSTKSAPGHVTINFCFCIH
jgi:hypothetical protein